ncbi:hypothetical protein [Deefgea sp. CFH1-16]|uniref:hypothetical protein n=1 Tax=Deefgea sp. CFH1-16 TaxID=2675457 RepID=UPI0019402FBC|nr:hypothetical protein [Deefgea sp. CFH1-16]MBM5573144.1 hypothetical protein [Deefgea sp. CFH1-16]
MMRNNKRFMYSSAWLLLLGVSPMAEANWFGDEWREFRSYPRMEKAYQRLAKGDYAGAHQLLEEVYKIAPSRRKTTLFLADVCSRQKDTPCLDHLSKDWLRRAPNDGMGYLLQAWSAYLKQDDLTVMNAASEALKRSALSATSRKKAAEVWLNAALRQGSVNRIQQALSQIAKYQIPLPRALLVQAEVVLQSAKSNPTFSAQLVPSAIPAMTAAMKPKITQQTAQRSKPAARTPVASAVFPYAALPIAQREQKITNDFSALIAKQQYKTLQLQLSQLRQAHLYTPALAEVVSNLLQEKKLPLVN